MEGGGWRMEDEDRMIRHAKVRRGIVTCGLKANRNFPSKRMNTGRTSSQKTADKGAVNQYVVLDILIR